MASEIEWNTAAGIAVEGMLERNENGNLYPLTSLEVQILNDIRDMLTPKEQEPAPGKKQPEKKAPDKPQDNKPQDKKEPEKKKEFQGLKGSDLT